MTRRMRDGRERQTERERQTGAQREREGKSEHGGMKREKREGENLMDLIFWMGELE